MVKMLKDQYLCVRFFFFVLFFILFFSFSLSYVMLPAPHCLFHHIPPQTCNEEQNKNREKKNFHCISNTFYIILDGVVFGTVDADKIFHKNVNLITFEYLARSGGASIVAVIFESSDLHMKWDQIQYRPLTMWLISSTERNGTE